MVGQLIVLGILVWAGVAEAACITYDRSAWTIEQKNFTQAIAYRLIFEAGENIVPTVTGDEVCFANSTVTLPTAQQILDRFAQDDAARAIEQAAAIAREQAFETEIATNNLCTAELQDIIDRIDVEQAAIQTAIDASNNLAQAKTAMTTMNQRVAGALKKVAKCLRAARGP